VGQVIIRNLDDRVLARLRARAARKGISLEGELRAILTEAARSQPAEFRARAAALRRKLGGRRHSDSTRLVREDRRR
jgi:plasmid stability protein